MAETNGFFSITECAARCGVTRAAIHRAIREERLTGWKVGNTFVIPIEAVDSYQPLKEPSAKGQRSGELRRQARAEKEERRRKRDEARLR